MFDVDYTLLATKSYGEFSASLGHRIVQRGDHAEDHLLATRFVATPGATGPTAHACSPQSRLIEKYSMVPRRLRERHATGSLFAPALPRRAGPVSVTP